MADPKSPKTIPVVTKDGDGFASEDEFRELVRSGRGALATPGQQNAIHQTALTELTKEKVAADPMIGALTFAKGVTDAANPLSLVGLSSENLALGATRMFGGGQEAAEELQKNVALGQSQHEGAYLGGSAVGLLAPGAAAKGLKAAAGGAEAADALGRAGEVAKSFDELIMAPIQGIPGVTPGIWGGVGKLANLGRAATPEAAALAAQGLEAEAAASGLGGVVKSMGRVGTEMAAFSAGHEFEQQLGNIIAQRDAQLDGAKLLAAGAKGFAGGALLGGALGAGGFALSGLTGAAEKGLKKAENGTDDAVRTLMGNDEKQILELDKGVGFKRAGEAGTEAFGPLGGWAGARKAGPRASYDAARSYADKVAETELKTVYEKAGKIETSAVADDVLGGMMKNAQGAAVELQPLYQKQIGNLYKRAGLVGEREADGLGALFVEGKIQPYLKGEKTVAGLEQETQAFDTSLKSAEFEAKSELARTQDARANAFDAWRKENAITDKMPAQRRNYVTSGALPEGYENTKGMLHDPKVVSPYEVVDEATGAVTSRQKELEDLKAKLPDIQAMKAELATIQKLAGKSSASEFIGRLKGSELPASEVWEARKSVDALVKDFGNPVSQEALKLFRSDMNGALQAGVERNLGTEAKTALQAGNQKYQAANAFADVLEKNLNRTRQVGNADKVAGLLGGVAAGGVGMSVAGPAGGYLANMAGNTAARGISSLLRDKVPFWKADLARGLESKEGVLATLKKVDATAKEKLSAAVFRSEKAIDAVSDTSARATRVTQGLATSLFGSDLATQRVNMGKFIASLKDEEGHVTGYANTLGPLAASHPGAASAMMETQVRALQFLQAVAPKGKVSAMSFSPFGQLDSTDYALQDMQRFARYTETVTDPDTIFERLGDSTLRQENVDAFKDVHRNLHRFYHDQFSQMMTDEKNRHKLDALPLQRKMQLSKLFDIPWFKFATPQMRMAFQATFSQESAQAAPSGGHVSQSQQAQTSGAYATMNERRNVDGSQG